MWAFVVGVLYGLGGCCWEYDMILAKVLSHVQHGATYSGIGIGCVLAIVLSWHRNKSILFGILHGVLSWLYVIYFALSRDDNEK